MAIFIAFWILIAATLQLPKGLQSLVQKSAADWLLDICGLIIQGIVIPALQIGLLYQGLHRLIPTAENCLSLSPFAAFFISTVLVDYGYYWNHRWLHTFGWPLHKVHHTVTQLDILGSSRNSLWTSFFILYLWVHTLMLYLLKDPTGYLWGISLTAMLDLWRHSRLGPNPKGTLYRLLSPWLILPQDHAQHHSQHHSGNFGANLKLWDHIHHTAIDKVSFPKKLGVATNLSFWQKLFYPFEAL
ncbi:sterol desaturase family protein [cf. Phormidesmis sp. LEGE 11477]|nr:sterol desaturase family protein [cf. Phormidesmis sp. LEGE 11477]